VPFAEFVIEDIGVWRSDGHSQVEVCGTALTRLHSSNAVYARNTARETRRLRQTGLLTPSGRHTGQVLLADMVGLGSRSNCNGWDC